MRCCADEDSPAGLARALDRTIVRYGARRKEHSMYASACFREQLCFEKVSETVVPAILEALKAG